MATEVKLPEFDPDVEESLITIWYVDEGDSVEEDEAIVEVQTEKAVDEITSPASGTIKEILKKRGDAVKVGEKMAVIE